MLRPIEKAGVECARQYKRKATDEGFRFRRRTVGRTGCLPMPRFYGEERRVRQEHGRVWYVGRAAEGEVQKIAALENIAGDNLCRKDGQCGTPKHRCAVSSQKNSGAFPRPKQMPS